MFELPLLPLLLLVGPPDPFPSAFVERGVEMVSAVSAGSLQTRPSFMLSCLRAGSFVLGGALSGLLLNIIN